MDFGFAPGTTPQDNRVRALFTRRTNTTLIHQQSIAHVADFLGHLLNTPADTKPVGNLLIGSHGNDQGWLQIGLDATLGGDIDFEKLVAAVTSGSVSIPAALITNPDDTPAAVTVHIRGCRIGMAKTYVEKLKEALGGGVTVTAPKHFHAIISGGDGTYEFLSYGFQITPKDAFPDRAALVAAFAAKNLKDIDGAVVPAAKWETWVPQAIGEGRVEVAAFESLGQSAGGVTQLSVKREFRHEKLNYVQEVTGLATQPKTHADKVDALKNNLSTAPLFATSHDFPVYERVGYAGVEEFVNGFKWAFTWTKEEADNILTCSGTRHDYTLLIPVTEPSTSNLIFNYYPQPGGPNAVVETMQETDARLFLTV